MKIGNNKSANVPVIQFTGSREDADKIWDFIEDAFPEYEFKMSIRESEAPEKPRTKKARRRGEKS